MSVNATDLGLSFEQSASLLNAIVKQASGTDVLAQINTGDFTSVATMALRNGYDPILNSISQVLTRTIFSIRPYSAKFKALRVTDETWGNATRKLTSIDRPVVDEDGFKLDETDPSKNSPWAVRLPHVIQTNFYGQNMYEDYITITRSQLNSAFESMSSWNSFLGMVMQNMLDKLEQYRENESRATIINLIGSTIACEKNNTVGGKRGRVRHLLTEFQTATGAKDKLTIQTLFGNTDNLIQFSGWLSGEMKTLGQRMSERTTYYHECPLDKDGNPVELKRHTDPSDMIVYMYSDYFNKLDGIVRPVIFNEGELKYVDYEPVSFWQSLQTPSKIDAKVSYLHCVKSEENVVTNDVATDTVTQDYVLGVWFDRDAAMLNLFDRWNQSTGMNPRKGFSTEYFHERDRWLNDNTENCVVFLLD